MFNTRGGTTHVVHSEALFIRPFHHQTIFGCWDTCGNKFITSSVQSYAIMSTEPTNETAVDGLAGRCLISLL